MQYLEANGLFSPGLILATVLGYAVMTVGMKATADGQMVLGLAIALAGFAAAFLAEILLMRRLDLSMVYVLIVTGETVLVLAYAAWLGEGLGARQAMGAAMVLAGLLFVST